MQVLYPNRKVERQTMINGEIRAGRSFLRVVFFLNIFVALYFHPTGHGSQSEAQPEFLAPLDNLTVTQGRDVSFTCVVNNLGQYRVSGIDRFNLNDNN